VIRLVTAIADILVLCEPQDELEVHPMHGMPQESPVTDWWASGDAQNLSACHDEAVEPSLWDG
jgi:hypothetical protein